MEKGEYVEDKTAWIRDISPGQEKTGFFSSYNELDTISTLVSRFNKGYGAELGLRIEGHRDWENKSYTIKCFKLDDHGNK